MFKLFLSLSSMSSLSDLASMEVDASDDECVEIGAHAQPTRVAYPKCHARAHLPGKCDPVTV